MAQLRPILPRIRALGAELYAIGCGTQQHLQWFLEDQRPEHPAYTDPTRRVYTLAGWKRGVWSTLGPQALLHFVRARLGGHRQPGIKGDPLQQGGVLIVLRGGEIAYRHASRAAGDHPSPERVLAALERSQGCAE